MTAWPNIFWDKIVSIGHHNNLKPQQLRQLRFMNGMAIIMTGVALFNALVALYFSNLGLVIANIIIGFSFLSCLLLNHYGKMEISKAVMFSSIAIVIAYVGFFHNVGIFLYLFPVFILAAFLIENRIFLYLYFLILFLLFLFRQLSGFDSLAIPEIMDDSRIYLSKNFIISILLSLFAINLFRKQNEHDKQLILEQNQLLNEKIKESEKNVSYANILRKEMNHRVKNNLQLISSLLNMHAQKIKDLNAHEALINAKHRVTSIALIHKQLYGENKKLDINIEEFVSDLIPFLKESLSLNLDEVDLKLVADNIILPTEDAISIGLLLNELLTNSFRHGVQKVQEKVVVVKVKKIDESGIRIRVEDSGTGIEKIENNKKGFGYQLIEMIVNNYNGKISLVPERNLIAVDLRLAENEHMQIKNEAT